MGFEISHLPEDRINGYSPKLAQRMPGRLRRGRVCIVAAMAEPYQKELAGWAQTLCSPPSERGKGTDLSCAELSVPVQDGRIGGVGRGGNAH